MLLLGCLPPATLQPAEASVAETEPDPAAEPDRCRALLGELDAAGRFSTRELRWGPRGVSENARAGLVVGDEEQLYELTLERRAYDATELYGDAQVRCEEHVIMRRKLPDGVARLMYMSRPACVGTADGERVALESSLRIISALGPYVGLREQVEGHAPELTSQLDYRTIDVRNAGELVAGTWLHEPTATMRSEFEQLGVDCERDDSPQSVEDIDGFAIRWVDANGPQLLFGYSCCGGRSCELNEALPKIDAELAALLPDPDRLLHSPFGCGSIGLDGQLRTRDGAVVGRVGLDAERVMAVVFLPAAHAFELDW
jgi:hypothetical protein